MLKPSLFSKRTDWSLETNTITAALDQLKADGKSIIDLTQSNPTRCQFHFPEQAILDPLSSRVNLIYEPHARGQRKAREVICREYQRKGFDVSPEEVFLTSSTSEAYSFLFRLLTNPDQRILFPRPSYPLFQFLVDLNDLHMDYYPLQFNEKWFIDFRELSQSIKNDTKAIVLVNPNNPTGSYIKKSELIQINDVCDKAGCALICDEVFWDYAMKQDGQVSLVNNKKVLTFVLGGLSKALALPQMKLSWIILSGPAETVKTAGERLEVIADTYLSINTPSQSALEEWFKHKDLIQKDILKRIMQNFNTVKNQAGQTPFCQVLEPEGGWYVVLKIPPIMSEEEWALKFLKEDHVFVHPGYFFDFEDEAYIIISLLPAPKDFSEGLKRLLKRIEDHTS